MKFDVAVSFSELPGGRYIKQGPHSGEDFRENYLKPLYDYCLENDQDLILNMDGGYGYAGGFLEEAFGGMVREGYDGRTMLRKIDFISNDDPELENRIVGYISDAIEVKERQEAETKKK